VQDDGSAATAMLRLAGMVLLAVSECAGELEQATSRPRPKTSAAAAGWRRPFMTGADVGAGPGRRWSAGAAGVGQAGLALPGAGRPGLELVEDQ